MKQISGGSSSGTYFLHPVWKRKIMQNVGRFYVLALFIVTLSKCFAVNITKISIPDFVQNGTEESVLFDCEYSYHKTEDKHLVVKWFYEDDPSPVYQWIPLMNTKIYYEKFRVIKDFELEDLKDPYTKARAFKIENPTTELSGTYRCQVESLNSADIEEDRMIVYALPSYVNLNYTIDDDTDTVRVVCEVDGVYPLPEVFLFQIPPGTSEQVPIDDLEWEFDLENGAYELEVYADIPEGNLSTGTLRYFGCIVTINGTDYKKVVKVPYFPNPIAEKHEGNDSDNGSQCICESSFYSIVFLLIVVFFLT